MALGARRVVEPAERDEAGEELGLLPRLPGFCLAVIGREPIGGLCIAQADQLAGQDLPLGPDGAGGGRREIGLQRLGRGPDGGGLRIAVAPAQQARAFIHHADVAQPRGAVRLAFPARSQPRLGRRAAIGVEPWHDARGGSRLVLPHQPVESAPMVVGGQDGGVALGESGLGGRIGGWALAPGLAQHRRCLSTPAGAAQRIGEALRGLDAAGCDAAEMAQHQRIVGVVGQQLLGAAGDGLGQGPIGVGGEPGGDLRPRGPAIAGLDAQPCDQLAGHRVGAGGEGLGVRKAAGLGGGQRLAAGGALRLARPGLGGGRAGEEKG